MSSLSTTAIADINDVVLRYATGIDRRDWPLFRTCFTDDCECDYGPIGVWHGSAAVTAWMEDAHRELGHTMHRMSNVAITPSATGAAVRTYVDAVLMAPDASSGHHAIGFYDDDVVETAAGWKIARRAFTMVRFEILTGSAGL